MRIQHNIPAMSSYRNYTNNVSALSKNLEKLSSGYKINRAGDDAAGLAISEKMRAQITGLETAQKNAKDGISLVQTAEGALTEVHDMLNRMVELATQSANGTYDDTTDRAQLQKEVDQLRSEINRIADSANFNGIKLLDGSLSETSTTIPGSALFLPGTKDANAFVPNTTGASSGPTGSTSVLHKAAGANGKTSFTVDLNGMSLTVASQTVGGTVNIKVGGVAMTMAIQKNKETLTATDIADALDNNYSSGITINGIKWDVKANGDKLEFTMSQASFTKATLAASFSGNFKVEIEGTDTTRGGKLNNAKDTNWGTTNIVEGSASSGVVLANTVQSTAWAVGDIKDKLTLQVGNEAYIFALTDDTFEKATAVANTSQPDGIKYKVVDVRDLTDPAKATAELNQDNSTKTGEELSNALTRLTEVAKDNDMFSVGLNDSSKLTFQEKDTYKGDARLDKPTTTDGKGLFDQFKVYKNGDFDVKSPTVSVAGKALTLQIGDTAESFNQLKVNVGDCHTASLGIADIDISKQDGAQTAIEKIKKAINTVSDTRGTLGATQNRLDHTINNLSVMTENIQDAESTIRDVDVAEEMMEYTKNNILVQSAQAMLAQANQLPQGVLQLLQ